MAVHEKTSKWLNNCVKREKHKQNKYSLKQGETGEKEQDEHLPAQLSHCNYCTKVFYDAKFLVKHILRRHCDKLIELHKNVVSVSKAEKIIHETPDLFQFVRAEFSDLKVEVDYIKKALAEHLNEKKDTVVENEIDNIPSTDKKDLNMNNTPISTKNDSLEYKQSEDNSNAGSHHLYAADIQNLQVRVDKLFQMFRETVISKEDIEKTIALNEERICKTLKDELLTEIQNILSNHQKKNEDDYKVHYIELQREIDKLEKAVQLNSKKIESPRCFQDIQSKFESRIQNLLTGHSLFTSSAKRNKMNKSKNLNNEQKVSLDYSKRKSKSIYTTKTVLNKSSDLSAICKNQDLNSSLNRTVKQNHFEGDTHVNKETLLFSPESNKLKMREQKKLHEFNSLIDNSENFTEKHLKEVELIVNEKLKSLNIDPSEEKIPSQEFEKKMRLINSEKEMLEKKYKNFSQTRDKLDNHINKVVKSKLRKKRSKKLRFSDSLDLPSPDTIDCDSALELPFPAKKQESAGFLVSSDLQAEGDSFPCENIDVENLSPIQESYEPNPEGSYTDYPLQSSTHQQNDYESFRRYIPASPIGCVVRNNASKISTDSLLQKSVEEMSDLSSLESIL